MTDAVEFYIPLGNLVDFEKERARILKEIENVNFMISRSENLLNNAGFMAKAPQKLIEEETAKAQINKDLKTKLLNQLENLNA